MPIDLKTAMAAEPTVREISWTDRDVLLYQLSLGAGTNATDPAELRYAYEKNLQVLPSFVVVAGSGVSAGATKPMSVQRPGMDIDLRKILHGGESITVHGPIPTSGTAKSSTSVKHIWDKGKAAVIVLDNAVTDLDGKPLWNIEMQIFARGEGGFGGEPGPKSVKVEPEGDPDVVVESLVSPQAALLYRLNGDSNPLHADPEFAKMAGFDKPILHGLASYGIACKAIVDGALDGDVNRIGSYSVRFAGIMFPGETLRTKIWRNGDQLTVLADCPERDGAPVLGDGLVTLK